MRNTSPQVRRLEDYVQSECRLMLSPSLYSYSYSGACGLKIELKRIENDTAPIFVTFEATSF